MSFPQPRWYKTIERVLLPTDTITRAVLLGIIAISVIMLFLPSRSMRLLWTVYMIAP